MRARWKIPLILLLSIILILAITTRVVDVPFILRSNERIIQIQGVKIIAEVVNTPEKMAVGLGNRPSLASGRGMLFVYREPGFYPFWMKNMQFSLDIIWIDENLTIIDITKNATPASYPETFQSSVPAQFILEVNAGFTDRYNIQSGDVITFDYI